jgi:acetate kinase
MGLTPTGGFMMSTRSGDLDPGILLYLLRQGKAPDELASMLDHQSGLLAVSEISSDVKTLLSARAANPGAALAIAMFCYQIRKFIGAFAAVLNGLDTLIFTGGIGERGAEIRAGICEGLGYLGLELDSSRNLDNAELISSQSSTCKARVIVTDEDLVIARHTTELLT